MLTKNINTIILNLLAILVRGAVSTPLTEKQTITRFIFSFGDSYTQTEFNITGTKPAPGNIFGNPPYPGVTTDNGANWIGVLVEQLAPPVTLSYDFAFSGATVDASIVPAFIPTVLSLVNQTQEWVQYVSPKPSFAPWTSENSLFAFWFGVNDIQNSFSNSQNKIDLHNAILTSYFEQVDILYELGARNFIFLTVPPINKTPEMIAEGPSAAAEEATQIAGFNSLLKLKASTWGGTHGAANISIYDTQSPFNKVLANPTAFGASANTTCFNMDGVSCVWWNNFHPGQAIQRLVGEGVFATLKAGGFF